MSRKPATATTARYDADNLTAARIVLDHPERHGAGPGGVGRGRGGAELPATERAGGATQWANATAGFWRDPDWLYCRDGRWRPVESGSFPLAHGAPARVGRLRGYGDAINAEAARALIETVMEAVW